MPNISWFELGCWLVASFCFGSGLTSWYWGKRFKKMNKEFSTTIDLIRGIYDDHNS